MTKGEIGFKHGIPVTPDKTCEEKIGGRTFIFRKVMKRKGLFLYNCQCRNDQKSFIAASSTGFYSERDLSPGQVEALTQFANFIAAHISTLPSWHMKARELLRALLQVPELATVGSAQERAAFIALRIDACTVRQAGQAIGVSKSQVTNLADLFQAKLLKRMTELKRKRGAGCSAEYGSLYRRLFDRLLELKNESGSDDYSWAGEKMSREDLAECFGGATAQFDDD